MGKGYSFMQVPNLYGHTFNAWGVWSLIAAFALHSGFYWTYPWWASSRTPDIHMSWGQFYDFVQNCHVEQRSRECSWFLLRCRMIFKVDLSLNKYSLRVVQRLWHFTLKYFYHLLESETSIFIVGEGYRVSAKVYIECWSQMKYFIFKFPPLN